VQLWGFRNDVMAWGTHNSSAIGQFYNLLASCQLYILVNSAARQFGSLENCRSTTCQIGAWQLGKSEVSQLSSFRALQFIKLRGQWGWRRQRTTHLLYMWINGASTIKPSSVQRATSPKHPCFFPPGKCVQIQWDVCLGHHLVMLQIVNHL